MQDPLAKAEARKEKKISKIMWRSIGAAGVGIGLFLLRFLVAPFLGDNEDALKAIGTFALVLIAFGGLMIAVFVVKRDLLPKVWIVMAYIVLPVIALKLLAGVL